MTSSAPDLPQDGRFVGAEHRFALRVYFEDTDLSGVVYHANYLRFLERARSDMLAVAGIDQRAAWDGAGARQRIARSLIAQDAPARLGDALLAVAGIDQRAAWDGAGAAYAISDLAIRYLAPARLGDALLVTSRLAAARAASVVIQQTVSRGREKLAEATVAAAFVAAGRPRRQPSEWRHIFEQLVAAGEPETA